MRATTPNKLSAIVSLPEDREDRQRIGQAISLVAYVSEIDGAIVVHVDTNDDTGHLRVLVNDGEIFDADPELGY